MKNRLAFIFIWMIAAYGAAFAASCEKVGQVCVEGPETRNIAGNPVFRSCWKYEDTYSCVTDGGVDMCAPLVATGSCAQTNSVCSLYAFNGDCLNYQNTYGCSTEVLPIPSGVTQLPTTYFVSRDEFDASTCSALAANPNCVKTKSECTQGPETRNINGLDVTRDCWEMTDTYMCVSPSATTSTCDPYKADPKCTETSSQCLDTTPGGDCGLKQHVYKCVVKEATTTETATCTNNVCMTGYCDTPTAEKDKDFAKAISGMELAREAVRYIDPDTMKVFRGVGSYCKHKLGGLINCCDADGDSSNASNASMFSASMLFVNESFRYLGSQYVFDSLYIGSIVNLSTLSNLYGSGGDFGGGGLSFYGLSYAAGLDPPFAFDPAGFAAAVAVQIVMSYLECDEDDKTLAMRKHAGLCTYVGSWCSTKLLGLACIEKKESYCCYNSKLSRIINEQGKAQLGLGYGGDVKNPDCSGFTLAELNSIDFATIDMSDFFGDIVPKDFNATLATDRVTTRVNDYFAAP